MFRFFFFLVVCGSLVHAGWIGDLPTARELKMSKEDYAFMCALSGLFAGFTFSFLITR